MEAQLMVLHIRLLIQGHLQLSPLLSGGAVLILNNDAIDENDRPFRNLEFSQCKSNVFISASEHSSLC